MILYFFFLEKKSEARDRPPFDILSKSSVFTLVLSLSLLRFMSSRLSVMSELDFPVPGVLVLGLTPNLGVTLLLLPGVSEGVLDGVGV